MKYFWFIFSAFIFFLAVSPCCEDEAMPGTVTATAFTDHHSEDQHHHDVCSPFCTCTSCGCHGCSAEAFQLVVIAALPQEFTDQQITPYTSRFVSDFEANIWQPPRLG